MKFLRTPFLQNTSVICLTVSFHKEVLYICSNLLLLEKWTKFTILPFVLSIVNVFYRSKHKHMNSYFVNEINELYL